MKMKILNSKYLLGLLLIFAACIDEEGDAISGEGINKFRYAAPGKTVVTFNSNTIETKSFVTIYRDAVSKSSMDKSITLDLLINEDSLTNYNTKHGTNYLLLDPAWYELSESGTITFAPGESAKTIKITLNTGLMDLSNFYAIPFVINNPSSDYELANSGVLAIVQALPINKYDGVYNYTGDIGRFDASTCELIELGGPVNAGITVPLETTGVNTVKTVLKWATGSTIGGIGTSQTITINPETNAVTLTANGANPANWGPIDGEPNYYDPETGDIYVSWKWSSPCAGATYGFIRHVHLKLTYKQPR
jgi:hypothetical protein